MSEPVAPRRFHDLGALRRFIAEDPGLSSLLDAVRAHLEPVAASGGDGAFAASRRIDPGHDVAHAFRVAFWTVRLGEPVVDPRCAIASALLHDVVNLPKDCPRRKEASQLSAEVARQLLPSRGFSPRQVEAVAQAIVTHSYSLGRVPTTPLGEALQDADRLEALGALGVLRTASCGVSLGATYFDEGDPWAERRELDDRRFTVDHFFVKLLGLARTMRTRAGRHEAARRRASMVEFLRQLGSEILVAPPETGLMSTSSDGRGASSREDEQELVYEDRAEDYDRLVSAEDAEGRLLPALEAIARLEGTDVLEVGVGTGRITRQLLARGARVTGFDRAEPMLAVARRRLSDFPASRWTLACADARALPIDGAAFDLAIAGWVFGHFRFWMPDGWRENVGAALAEMERTLRPGGALIVVETLGTGVTLPGPPNAALAEYYAWLEDRGLARTTIATDYRFGDAETAARVLAPFFGAELASQVRAEGRSTVPEWTGIWTMTKTPR